MPAHDARARRPRTTTARPPPRGATGPSEAGISGSAERAAAGAGAAGVRVVDREALLLDRVREADLRALEVGHAHAVHDDLDAVEVAQRVPVEQTLVEVELVDQAGTAAGLDGHTQTQVVAALLLEQAANLVGGDVGQVHAVRGDLGGVGHASSNRRTFA